MKRDKKLEEQLIELSHYRDDNKAIPLVIEYIGLYLSCRDITKCDSNTASNYAITFLRNKYEPKKPQVIDYFDDVNIINPNIQRK